jgi:hypothetical protein
MILCGLNLITPVDLYYVLHKNNKVHTMEKLLVTYENIPSGKVRSLVDERKNGVYSFFDLIVKHNIFTLDHLQQRVFELYHIPYRYANRFVYDKKNKQKLSELLDKNVAFNKRVIPMISKNSSFIAGITDPESLVFIYELNFRLPHYRIIPVFIPLPHFKRLYYKLYNSLFPDVGLSFNSTDSTTAGFRQDMTELHRNSENSGSDCLNTESVFFFRDKIVISDPEKDERIIFDLYSKYETILHLTGKKNGLDRFAYFKLFIKEKFIRITESCRCKSLEIVLYGEKDRINLVAKPV